jgi:hypothetical protein
MVIKKLQIITMVCLALNMLSCQENGIMDDQTLSTLSPSSQTRSVIPDTFDWENADWMPTPSGQSRIPTPWVGQGSLASMFGLDVINDRKKSDGWELMYNTFTKNAPGNLENPYFVLYNKYRGLLRIFLYTTTQFISPSTYLQDGISVISNQKTTLLNFLGSEFVDGSKERSSYQQMQPAPSDGSMPLASNKWYMMQYEMAYDPNISKIPYNQVQLNWDVNYYNVENINMGGEIQGTINGTIGGSSDNNMFTPLKTLGTTIGKGVLAGIGVNTIHKNTIDKETGENKLGLSKETFKDVTNGVNSALSAAAGDLPGAIIGLFSAIIGGSNTTPLPVSLNVSANITLKGTGTNSGSFPSMPVSFWMPGTNIPYSAVGYIPLYGKSLGVVNFIGKPDIIIPVKTQTWETRDEPFDPDRVVSESESYAYPPDIDYSKYLIINPEVEKIAKVEILKQDLIAKDTITNEIYINPESFHQFYSGMSYPSEERTDFPKAIFCVRFTIKVTPSDGAPASTLYKSFRLNDIWEETYK